MPARESQAVLWEEEFLIGNGTDTVSKLSFKVILAVRLCFVVSQWCKHVLACATKNDPSLDEKKKVDCLELPNFEYMDFENKAVIF